MISREGALDHVFMIKQTDARSAAADGNVYPLGKGLRRVLCPGELNRYYMNAITVLYLLAYFLSPGDLPGGNIDLASFSGQQNGRPDPDRSGSGQNKRLFPLDIPTIRNFIDQRGCSRIGPLASNITDKRTSPKMLPVLFS